MSVDVVGTSVVGASVVLQPSFSAISLRSRAYEIFSWVVEVVVVVVVVAVVVVEVVVVVVVVVSVLVVVVTEAESSDSQSRAPNH